jgi:Zn-dependent protease
MRIARIAGIPIRLHWSFLVLLVAYAVGTFATSGLDTLASTLLVATALFTSVIVHELGHALAARAFGIETAHITLYPFGGVAAITRMPASPKHELVVALAGPAVNFFLASGTAAMWLATGREAFAIVMAINLVMGVFNLVPAFPMDGGRVLRALLASRLGYVQASRIAMRIGRVFALMFLVLGLASMNPSLVFVALFLFYAVSIEARRLAWSIQKERMERWHRRILESAAAVAPVTAPKYQPRWRITPPAF